MTWIHRAMKGRALVRPERAQPTRRQKASGGSGRAATQHVGAREQRGCRHELLTRAQRGRRMLQTQARMTGTGLGYTSVRTQTWQRRAGNATKNEQSAEQILFTGGKNARRRRHLACRWMRRVVKHRQRQCRSRLTA